MLAMTLWSAAAALVFLAVLAWGLVHICKLLESIGGTPTSYLAKLRFGLRAIDKECSYLGPQVTRINTGLGAVAGGLMAVQGELGAVADKLAPSRGA
jgi:hypothetical protein